MAVAEGLGQNRRQLEAAEAGAEHHDTCLHARENISFVIAQKCAASFAEMRSPLHKRRYRSGSLRDADPWSPSPAGRLQSYVSSSSSLPVYSPLPPLFSGLVDARGQFGTGLFPVVVSRTRADKSRLFLDFQRQQPVNGLVIGSSRSMRVAPAYLTARTGLRFFNFGVDDARAEDYLAIERWVRAHGGVPRLAVMGLDIEALHDDDEPDPEFLTDPEFRRQRHGLRRRGNDAPVVQEHLHRLVRGGHADVAPRVPAARSSAAVPVRTRRPPARRNDRRAACEG